MKFLFLITALTLLIAGCSDGKDQAGATGSGAGIERQQERDEFRNEYNANDANITTPIDSRPDLEEEE